MQLSVLLGLSLALGLSYAQETCPIVEGVCTEKPLAIKKVTKSENHAHFYIGGLFGIHNKGDTAYECDDSFRIRGIMNLQAFLWAIRYFEVNNEIIPLGDQEKVSIGGIAFDNCLRKEQTVGNIMAFEQCRLRMTGVDRRQLLAFVGPDTSTEALSVASLVNDFQITVVSHAATSPELSDGRKYRYFLRTVPSDANDVNILAEVLSVKLQAKYVQVVYVDNDYGRHGMEEFKERAKEKGICVVQTIKVTAEASTSVTSLLVDQLQQKRATRLVVLIVDGDTANRILRAIQLYNTGAGQDAANFVFLGTSSWGKSDAVLNDVFGAANNSIVTHLTPSEYFDEAVSSFKRYWDEMKPDNQGVGVNNDYLKRFWEDRFNCRLESGPNQCNVSTQNLRDIEMDSYVPYTIMAVASIVRGIYDASKEHCLDDFNMCSTLLNINNRGTAIFNGIKNYRVDSKKFFNDDQSSGLYTSSNPSSDFTNYEVYAWVKDEYKLISKYRPGSPLSNEDQIELNQYVSTCDPTTCLECGEKPSTTEDPTTSTPSTMAPTTMDPTTGDDFASVRFPIDQELTGAYFSSPRGDDMWMTRFEIGQRWIIALGVLAGLGILAVIIFEIYILYKLLGTRMGSRWRTMWLGQLLLFGIFLSFLTLFAYILIPTKATCGITRFGVGVSYSIMFAVLLVKLMVILTSKTSDASLLPGDMESPNYLKGIYQFLMFMFAVGVQVVIDAQWLITVPPEAVLVRDNTGNDVWICNHYTWKVSEGMFNMTSFVRNEFENHLLSLVYIMFLILITTVLALNAHGIITNHRESIFIGISAGFTIPIWLAWGLVGGLNRGHDYAHEFGDACLAFGLFLTATLILFAMFLPKVRQLVNIGVEGIYFEDDRETYYAGSVIMSPPSYKSKPNSVIYVNNAGGIYSEPVTVGNGDPMATHLKHPGQPGPMSTYSAPPGYLKRSDAGSKVLRVTPDLTGKHPTERRRPQSEYAYVPRSVKGTLKRSRSQQNLGAL